MAELRDVRPAPRVPVWVAIIVLLAALAATAVVDGEAAGTVATIVAVLAGWLAAAGTARRWTIGPWGALAAAAAACGILLLQDPGYRVLGGLFVAVGLLGLPLILAIARVKRYADRMPETPRSTEASDLFGSGRVDSGPDLSD
ncbi:hypothetical protein EV646_107288 [Kribbella antiqua]|uniref:Uncharacterized protein n=1 Tax=Kribbella antiqua TaxID=2512217 RepID=A0A4R2IMJ9_9ACTN|nr:hypothetical protein [Kribbella antiqua]TCO46264.1 hypothetical protein EV646_107288 [Kribbella antiqua]